MKKLNVVRGLRISSQALRIQAVASQLSMPIHWFSELALDFGVSDPSEIGSSLDCILITSSESDPSADVVELWRLAARAYHIAKMDDDAHRCLGEAAEALVAQADAIQGSAILSSHFLSNAIAQLHNIPGKKDRRTELRHRLIDVQGKIIEEMSSFTQELDLREIYRNAETAVSNGALLEKLFVFADLSRSPDPKSIADEAIVAIRKYPLSTLFGGTHIDREGKVIHRSLGNSFGDSDNKSAIQQQILQSESLRRKLVASGRIGAAMHVIIQKHFISDDVLVVLLKYSPFIPSDILYTFARGFARFFQGDFVSATYILTPLLENSLRHILKLNGHDVTKFDDVNQTQEDRSISSLFLQMRQDLDNVLTPAIAADIERVFLVKPGPYIRHSVAHGLMNDGDPYGADAIYACWLIFRICLLPLVRHFPRLQADLEGSELCR